MLLQFTFLQSTNSKPTHLTTGGSSHNHVQGAGGHLGPSGVNQQLSIYQAHTHGTCSNTYKLVVPNSSENEFAIISQWNPGFKVKKNQNMWIALFVLRFSPIGPCQGISDRAKAAEASMKEDIIEANVPKNFILWIKIDDWDYTLTCINSQHIWIINTINCQQVTQDLQ